MGLQSGVKTKRDPPMIAALTAGVALLALVLVLATAAVVRIALAAVRPHHGPPPPAAAAPATAPVDQVRVQVEHTLFHPMDNVALDVERLDGRMIGKPGELISLDDHNSFSVQIDHAVTRLNARDLSALINSYLLKQAASPIRHVDVSFDGQQLVMKGKVHKLLTLPFEGRGAISATPEGELRMHMTEFRVAGVLTQGLLNFFGIRLDNVAQPEHKASFRVEGEDFITALNELFPPPRVYGHLTRVHVEGQDLVQEIGVQQEQHAIEAIPKALPEPANYVYFTGGRMRFGRMTMENVDLKMVDQIPQNVFDFSLDHYEDQIQAGYVKVLPDLGVVVYAADWHTLQAARRGQH